MMINDQLVRHVAHLARIGVSQEEVKKFAHELAGILEYVAQLKELDVSDVEPIAHITGLENAGRGDQLGEPRLPAMNPNLLEEQAPGHADGEVRVPRILP